MGIRGIGYGEAEVPEVADDRESMKHKSRGWGEDKHREKKLTLILLFSVPKILLHVTISGDAA